MTSSTDNEVPDGNPYKSPESDFDELPRPDVQTEQIRQKHIFREYFSKIMGSLLMVVGSLGTLLFAGLALASGIGREAGLGAMLFLCVICMIVTMGLGWGLLKLSNLARVSFGIFVSAILFVTSASWLFWLTQTRIKEFSIPKPAVLVMSALFIPTFVYLLFFMLAPKTRRVFSEKYREIIRKTPGFHDTPSCVAAIIQALLMTAALVVALFVTFFTICSTVLP